MDMQCPQPEPRDASRPSHLRLAVSPYLHVGLSTAALSCRAWAYASRTTRRSRGSTVASSAAAVCICVCICARARASVCLCVRAHTSACICMSVREHARVDSSAAVVCPCI